jgi:prepilin-type N-terminal cleavage/methylation domain-containing protein
MKNPRIGFTLVELLMVIAIVVVLAAVLFPVFARASEESEFGRCTSNLRQTGASIELYRADDAEHLPHLNFGVVSEREGKKIPHPLDRYGLKDDVGHCDRSTRRSDPDYSLLVDYLSRFALDLSVLKGGHQNWYRVEPEPNSVYAWDWAHLKSDNLLGANEVWLALSANGSVRRVKVGAMRRAYLSGSGWTFEVPSNPNTYYEFVFPGEDWSPAFTKIGDTL